MTQMTSMPRAASSGHTAYGEELLSTRADLVHTDVLVKRADDPE